MCTGSRCRPPADVHVHKVIRSQTDRGSSCGQRTQTPSSYHCQVFSPALLGGTRTQGGETRHGGNSEAGYQTQDVHGRTTDPHDTSCSLSTDITDIWFLNSQTHTSDHRPDPRPITTALTTHLTIALPQTSDHRPAYSYTDLTIYL